MSEIMSRVDQLIDTHNEVCKAYKWESSLARHFVALTYTLNKKEFNKESLQNMREFIKENTGAFSYFRGNMLIMIAALLTSKYDEPEKEFIKVLDYSKKMKEVGFKSGPYLPIAAYALLLTCEEEFIDSRISKAFEVYTEMKKKHFWLTGGDDYPLSVLIAASEDTVYSNIEKKEECYSELNSNGFMKGNSLQFLSHILSFSNEDNRIKADRCRVIFDKLKDNKMKVYGTYYGALGFLALLGEESESAVDQVVEVARALKTDKKYKWLGKNLHILTGAALVSDSYVEKLKDKKDLIQTTLGISIEALIAAQTAATMAAVSASAAASSSASS